MKEELTIPNQRMLQLMKDAIHSNLAENEKDFAVKIGFNYSNLPKAKSGGVSFTVDQIAKACILTGANANWVLGLEKNKKRGVPKDPFEMIRTGLEALEQGVAKKKGG